MRVADGQPQPSMSRRAIDDGTRIRKTRPTAEPRSPIGLLSQWEQFAHSRHDPKKLYRSGRCIARRKLGAGGHAQSLLHRGNQVADVCVKHRPRQARIPLGPKMSVVAPLNRERQSHPESIKEVGRPRPKCDHALLSIERTLRGVYSPAITCTVKRSRIARYQDTSQRGKARRIGSRHPERIADARRLWPEYRLGKYRIE